MSCSTLVSKTASPPQAARVVSGDSGTLRTLAKYEMRAAPAWAGTSAPTWVTGGWGLSLLPFQQMPLRKPAGKTGQGERKAGRGRAARDRRPRAELVIITGMSGSGKASVLKAFEDLGYYCVDNLPVELIPRFAELARQSSEIERTALVVDVREGTQLEALPADCEVGQADAADQSDFSGSERIQCCCAASARPGGRIRWERTRRCRRRWRRSVGICVRIRGHGRPGHRYLEVQCSRTAVAHHRTLSEAGVGASRHSGFVRELRIQARRARRRRPGVRRSLSAQSAFCAGVSPADRTRSQGREIYPIVSADQGIHQPDFEACWSICCRTTSARARVI